MHALHFLQACLQLATASPRDLTLWQFGSYGFQSATPLCRHGRCLGKGSTQSGSFIMIPMTNRVVLAAGILAVMSVCAMSAGPATRSADDKDRLQGTWGFGSVIDQGKEQPMPK